MKENIKLGIYEGAVALAALLVLVFCALPSFVCSGYTLSHYQLIFGYTGKGPNGLLIFGFILVVLSFFIALAGSLLSFLDKRSIVRLSDDKTSMIAGIAGGLFLLAGGILLTCAILITGLDKENSELGLIQGNWSIGPSNYLVLVFTLIGFAASYPSALVVLHHRDLLDKNNKKTAKEPAAK
jgi:hypothetical protein